MTHVGILKSVCIATMLLPGGIVCAQGHAWTDDTDRLGYYAVESASYSLADTQSSQRPVPLMSWYAVIGATSEQETVLRSQIQVMHPEVLPLRILFVPHWKYVHAARVFRVHVPAGLSSVMFTHLASRTVFIDNARYLGADWLGYWIAHELGHLVKNSVDERDAEKAAHELRRRLKGAHPKNPL